MRRPVASAVYPDADLQEIRRRLIESGDLDECAMLSLRSTMDSRLGRGYSVDGGGQHWVLHRADDDRDGIETELRVQVTLGDAEVVPVPEIVQRDTGASRYYLARRVAGTVLRTDIELDAVPVHLRKALGYQFIDSLTSVHGVDLDATGLDRLCADEASLEVHLAQVHESLERAGITARPDLRELFDSLAATIPKSGRSVLRHGDYQLRNVVWQLADAVRVSAVLDWRHATVGDPFVDLGVAQVFWSGLHGVSNRLFGCPSAHRGYPSFDQLIERYSERSGLRTGSTEMSWYYAFGFLVVAARICGSGRPSPPSGTVGHAGVEAVITPLVTRGIAAIEGNILSTASCR